MSEAQHTGELPDLPELEPLDAPLQELPAEAAAAAPSGAPRELEQAPLMLRKAALILAVAALLPWLRPGGFDLHVLGSKALILVAGLLAYWGVLAAHGEKAPGFVSALGKANPAIPGWIAMVLMGVACAPVIDGWHFGGLVEKASLAVGILVWLQVLAYEKGGKFNPVGGMVIPLLGIAALGRIATVFTAEGFDVLALLGSLGVLAAGGLAGYTMFAAMKEAKAHGEAKKKAALEERKRARAAQRDKQG